MYLVMDPFVNSYAVFDKMEWDPCTLAVKNMHDAVYMGEKQ